MLNNKNLKLFKFYIPEYAYFEAITETKEEAINEIFGRLEGDYDNKFLLKLEQLLNDYCTEHSLDNHVEAW